MTSTDRVSRENAEAERSFSEHEVLAAWYMHFEQASPARAAKLLGVEEERARNAYRVRASLGPRIQGKELHARVRMRVRELAEDIDVPPGTFWRKPDCSNWLNEPLLLDAIVDESRRLSTPKQAALVAGISAEELTTALNMGRVHLASGKDTPEAKLRRAWDEVRTDEVAASRGKLLYLRDNAESEAVQLSATTKILETFDKRFEPRSRKDVNVKVSGGVRVEKLSIVGQLPVGDLASLLNQMRIGGGDGLGNVLDVSPEDRPEMIEAASEDE